MQLGRDVLFLRRAQAALKTRSVAAGPPFTHEVRGKGQLDF